MDKQFFIVIEDEYNRNNYPRLIGEAFINPPNYVHIIVNPFMEPDYIYKDFEDWQEKNIN